MKEESIKKNFALSTLYHVLTVILPFISAPYISRVIGDRGIGVYSYTNSVQMYFSLFAALGTAQYGSREIARNRHDKAKRSKVFWEIEFLSILLSLIVLIFWFFLILFTDQYRTVYLVLTINILNTMLDISWFYTGIEQFKYTIRQNTIFKILGVIALFVFVKKASDLTLYIAIVSISTLLGTCSMWLYLPKFIEKCNFKELKLKKHFHETLIYFIPTIATSIYAILDKTLIGLITHNEYENGYYEQATKVINMIKAFTFSSLNTVLGSRISYLFAEKKEEEIKQRINFSMEYILFMGIGCCIGLIMISDKFVPFFFGEGYDPVVFMLKLLSPVIAIVGISNCLGFQYFNPAGLRKKSAKYIIIGSVINLISNLILIPKFGAVGAIIGTLIAEFIITALYVLNCDRYITISQIITIGYKKLIAGLCMGIVIYFTGYIPLNDLLTLVVQIMIGIITYVFLLLAMKDNMIIHVLKNTITRIKRKTN